MYRRYTFVHLILTVVVVLDLTVLMVCVEAQGRIAFTSKRDGHIDIHGWPTHEIYVMDADGKNQHRLTNNQQDDLAPSWSPDGKRIAFYSNRDGHAHAKHGWPTSEIYVMDTDGGNPQNLTNNPHDDTDPSWSPDGKRIAFSSDRDGFQHDLVITSEIYVMDADGGNPQNLTNNPFDDRDPSWSPDGKRIAFSSTREGHFRNRFGLTDEIYLMDADGENEQRLTENRNNDWDPVWSPDSKRIAFAADRKGDLVSFDIFVMDADGENQRKLTNNRGWDSSPSWSPDGERIAFTSERAGNYEIYMMAIDGGNEQNLTNNPDIDASPAWLHTPFSISPAGKQFTIWGRVKQVDR